ncbi:MAG: quinone oxidoreductase [Proteobacteria bacterium]|nr:quinone oxidoreductase [Pseudomonadota bacterium]
MTKAIRIHKNGPPSVMKWEEVDLGKPAKGEVRLRQTAVGLNFIDTYQRSGLYPLPLPMVLGSEGAGIVEAVGRGVIGIKAGDRVAYAGGPIGAYAEQRNIPAEILIKIPKEISDQTAAAMMLKGMTARYLLRDTYRVKKGDTILIHAAAGGLGLILCQWANHLGATVIGTVGTKKKAELARAHGCHHPILYTKQNFVDQVKRLTKGAGVPVVYDSIGKDTFPASLDCLQKRGLFVSFGNASGPIPPFVSGILAQKGSLYMTRPSLFDYIGSRPELEANARDLIGVVKKGVVKIEINQTYALKDAASAHRDLEGRKTTGSTVLLP